MRQDYLKNSPGNFFLSSEHMWYAPLTLIWPWQQELSRVFGGFAYGV